MTVPLLAATELSAGAMRALRAGVLTVPAVGIALVTHLSADGCTSAAGVFAAMALTWPAAVLLLSRQRRLPVLLTWLVGVQVSLHVLLSSFCTDVTSGQVTVWHAVTSLPTDRMLLAHCLAVLATGVVLGRADAGLWATKALVRAVGRLRLPTAVPPVRACGAPVALRAADGSMHLPRLWSSPRPVRRGPPALAAR